MSARCEPFLDGAKSRLVDSGQQIISVHRFIELFGVNVQCDAYVRVARDLAHSDRVKYEPHDQVRDERPPTA